MNLFTDNLILKTDSYKPTHWQQYPPDSKRIFSYLEPRGGEFDEVCWNGLQPIMLGHLTEPVTMEMLWEAEEILGAHFGRTLFNREGWLHIIRNHDGKLPLRIKALPEGTVVPTHVALMTIENTDPKCYWLTNYVESLLMHAWYPTTVASLSRAIKKDILSYLESTGTPENIESSLQFKLHDFGFRGATCPEQAAIGGAAHAINFLGSDTLVVIPFLRKAYGFKGMPVFSVPATEHSTMTSWGEEGELEAYENCLDKYPEDCIFSAVSDSYDIYRAAAEYWGGKLRDRVMRRSGKLVIRPDSGDAGTVILNLLEICGNQFGFTTNVKGYKVLPPQVGIIQGDGVNRKSINSILLAMKWKGWSADNIVFGMGGALLQGSTRDTMKFAIKCSAIERGNSIQDVWKDPVTDPGKVSKRGLLSVVKRDGTYVTIRRGEERVGERDLLETVYENGFIKIIHNFDDVRSRAAIGAAVSIAA